MAANPVPPISLGTGSHHGHAVTSVAQPRRGHSGRRNSDTVPAKRVPHCGRQVDQNTAVSIAGNNIAFPGRAPSDDIVRGPLSNVDSVVVGHLEISGRVESYDVVPDDIPGGSGACHVDAPAAYVGAVVGDDVAHARAGGPDRGAGTGDFNP